MSTTLAIATITSALATLLRRAREPLPGDPPDDTSLSDLEVTTTSLDKARTQTANQLNLFLYNVAPNPTLRNVAMPIPGAGSLESAPLALDLHYLVTAYGQNDQDDAAHRALGRAMTVLHRHAVLFPSELSTALAEGGVHEQHERVRITPSTLSTEEMSKLWTTFQTNYRLSVAYQVSVVLLESGARVRAAAPVLRPVVSTSTGARVAPRIDHLATAGGREAAVLGSSLTLEGSLLALPALTARISHPRVPTPLSLPLAATPDGRSATLTLPTAAAAPSWAAGPCVVELVTPSGARSAPTPLAIAPVITSLSPMSLAGGPGTEAELTIEFSPAVLPRQRVELALGDVVLLASERAVAVTTITFLLVSPKIGDHQARLRVDGVESLLEVVTDPVSGLPTYGASHVVEVTP